MVQFVITIKKTNELLNILKNAWPRNEKKNTIKKSLKTEEIILFERDSFGLIIVKIDTNKSNENFQKKIAYVRKIKLIQLIFL